MSNIRVFALLTIVVALTMLFVVVVGLARTAQPSADVIAEHERLVPILQTKDFQTGQVEILFFNNLPIIVWRRDAADRALAAQQDDPELWRHKHTEVYGLSQPVYASDDNLTLNGEWFIAVAHLPDSKGWFPMIRAGQFHGFFEAQYATHYDLSGRTRKGGLENLTIVAAEISRDGKTIQLDLRPHHPSDFP